MLLDHTSSRSNSSNWRTVLRLVLAGACAAFLLVALSGIKAPDEPKVMRHESVQRDAKTCVNRLIGHSASLTKENPWKPESFIATVDMDGMISKKSWSKIDEDLARVSSEYLEKKDHKDIQLTESDQRLIVFPDNTVMDLNTRKCEISGLYLHAPDGQLHPLVQNVVQFEPKIAPDCSKYWGRCCKDGQCCRDKMTSYGRGQWSSVSCPSGWSKNTDLNSAGGGTQPQYTCCSSSACVDPIKCDNVGSYGKCALTGASCNLVSGLSDSITDSSTVIGNIQASADVAAAIASMVGGVGGNGVSLISAFVGYSSNLGRTPESVYNELTAKLVEFAENIEQCIELTLTQTIINSVQTPLTTIRTDLAPDTLGASEETTEEAKAQERIDDVYEPVLLQCKTIGAIFYSLELDEDNDSAYQVLPLGLEAVEMCMANYAAHVADASLLGTSVSGTQKAQYGTMIDQVASAMAAVIPRFEATYSTEQTCNFFDSDKAVLTQTLNVLNTALADVNKLKDAFNTYTSTFIQLGDWRMGDVDDSHFSICHCKSGADVTVVIYRKDGTVHSGPRTDYNLCSLPSSSGGFSGSFTGNGAIFGNWCVGMSSGGQLSISYGSTSAVIYGPNGGVSNGPLTGYSCWDYSGNDVGQGTQNGRQFLQFGTQYRMGPSGVNSNGQDHFSVASRRTAMIYRSDGNTYAGPRDDWAWDAFDTCERDS